MATDINDQGIAGGAGVVSIDTGPPAAGTPYFTFKQFSIVVDGAATETAHNYVELPSVDMTNLVEVNTGQFYFMVRSGTSWLLCQYNAGDSFYTTLHTFLAAAVPAIPYDWQDFTLAGNGQIDQSLYRKSDGTLLWMRHGTCVVNGVQTNRICVIEVTLTALTILPDVLDLGPWYWGFQTWGTYSDSPEVIVGEVGDDSGTGGNVQGMRWWVDNFAIAGAPLAGYPMLRRWFVENPGSDLLIAGHFGPYGGSPTGGLAVVVPEIVGTEVTDWGAAGGRGDVMLLAGGNGIAFEGEAGGSGEVNIVGTTTEVSFDGKAGGLGTVIISPRCELTLEGKAGGRGTATVGDGTVLAFDGMAGGLGEITFPSWYPGVQGYSGAELALHTPTYASPALWTWGAARPAGYDTRANRAFGARMRSSSTSQTTPRYDRPINTDNPLVDYISFWSWCSQYEDNDLLLWDASQVEGPASLVNVEDQYDLVVSGAPAGYNQVYSPVMAESNLLGKANAWWPGSFVSEDGNALLYTSEKILPNPLAGWTLANIDGTIVEKSSLQRVAPWNATWPSITVAKSTITRKWRSDGVGIFAPMAGSNTAQIQFNFGLLGSAFTLVFDYTSLSDKTDRTLFYYEQRKAAWPPGSYLAGSMRFGVDVSSLYDNSDLSFGYNQVPPPNLYGGTFGLASKFAPNTNHRAVLSVRMGTDAKCWVDGTLLTTLDLSSPAYDNRWGTGYFPYTSSLGFAFLDAEQDRDSLDGVLHEVGFINNYAATADDVATNPALARRYGLAATPPPWET